MSIKNFFYWSYWFDQPYIARGWLSAVLWIGVLLIVGAGIALYVIRRYEPDHLKKEVLRRFGNLALVIGTLALIWVFFRQERIPFLAWRFWLVLLAMLFAWWLAKIVRYMKKRLPAIKAEQAIRERREKYLPKPKK